ncbi:hypothetical protein BDV98DRAFT_315563 [Pterulicium gracile]|uniref:Uncharacterized protein n=1 Tax=Pterulicium gracile TaxID=1884261 RepID=A0A5C3R108_9AGAR|nr:hypothetical protein BDV98DRAFT_315563 [Pterula gracilis]
MLRKYADADYLRMFSNLKSLLCQACAQLRERILLATCFSRLRTVYIAFSHLPAACA